MAGVEANLLPTWVLHRERKMDRAGLDGRRCEADVGKAAMRCFEIVHHQVEWRRASYNVIALQQHEVCSAPQLQDSDVTVKLDRAEPDLGHEFPGIRKSVRLHHDMTDPHRRSLARVSHDSLPIHTIEAARKRRQAALAASPG